MCVLSYPKLTVFLYIIVMHIQIISQIVSCWIDNAIVQVDFCWIVHQFLSNTLASVFQIKCDCAKNCILSSNTTCWSYVGRKGTFWICFEWICDLFSHPIRWNSRGSVFFSFVVDFCSQCVFTTNSVSSDLEKLLKLNFNFYHNFYFICLYTLLIINVYTLQIPV